MSKSIIGSSEDNTKHEIVSCKRCGTRFECKVGDVSNCQCSAVTISDATRKFLDKTSFGCLCASCVKNIDQKVIASIGISFPKTSEQIEHVHYYIENGFYVFTEHYHILRGSCCKSGCRHCPYGFEKLESNSIL